MTASIAQQEGNLVLTVPKKMVSDEFFNRIVEWIEYLNLVQQSQLKKEDADLLSEEIKEDWWKENKGRILAKVKGA